jgi:uroporphyrinogen-III decarboxylase
VAEAPPDPYADLRARHAAAVEDSYRCGGVNTPFCTAIDAFGYEGAMLAMHDRPDVFAHFIERALERCLEVVRTAPVDGFWFDEYYTDVIAPGHYQEYVYRPNVKLAQALRRSGKASTYYFCGDIMPKLEGVCALEVDAIAFEESKKWFRLDLAEVAGVVRGRKALCGNMDGLQLLPRGSREQIAAEVCRQLDVAACNGGFVMGAGSPIAPDTPLANMRAFLNATREFGVYPLKLPR